MPRTIRFHLDEHVNPAVADALRRRGINVSTAAEAGLLGADDTVHISHGLAHRRVIFTNDSDFIILHDNGIEHYGIAYCHQQNRTVGQILHSLELI